MIIVSTAVMFTLQNETTSFCKFSVSNNFSGWREMKYIKFRHYEKATKFEKNIPPVLTKQLFLLSSVKTSGRFFQIFVAFSEKLNFTYHLISYFLF